MLDFYKDYFNLYSVTIFNRVPNFSYSEIISNTLDNHLIGLGLESNYRGLHSAISLETKGSNNLYDILIADYQDVFINFGLPDFLIHVSSKNLFGDTSTRICLINKEDKDKEVFIAYLLSELIFEGSKTTLNYYIKKLETVKKNHTDFGNTLSSDDFSPTRYIVKRVKDNTFELVDKF